jgi:hypothetical protein
VRANSTVIQLVRPEFEAIRQALLAHGAQGRNPLMLDQELPAPGQICVLFDEDLRRPHIRVSIADKPNLAWPGDEHHEYREAACFDPVSDGPNFLGWVERGTIRASMSSDEIVATVLEWWASTSPLELS